MTDLNLSTTYQLFEFAYDIITLHVVKTFKMYFLSNFQVYNTVLLTRVTMVFIRFPWPYTPYTSLYLLTNISTSSLPPCSRHHMLTLCFYEFGFIDTTCKTDRTKFCLSPSYFIYYSALKAHPCGCKWHDFLILNCWIYFIICII